MKIKLNAAKVLPIVAAGLSVLSMVVDSQRQASDRKALKAELKDEVIKDLLSKEG